MMVGYILGKQFRSNLLALKQLIQLSRRELYFRLNQITNNLSNPLY